jgi:hypothetical protein
MRVSRAHGTRKAIMLANVRPELRKLHARIMRGRLAVRLESQRNSCLALRFVHVRARFTEASVKLRSLRYRQMILENSLLSSQAKRLSIRWLAFGWASLLQTLVSFFGSGATSAQAPLKRGADSQRRGHVAFPNCGNYTANCRWRAGDS